MSDEEGEFEAEEVAAPAAVGERLSEERKSQGIELNTIAERTRIPIRHLTAIENSDFASLPGATYTLGFARSYARSLGLDATEISSSLRQELSENGNEVYGAASQSYEPTDPARIPTALFAWSAAGIAVILVAAYFIWRSFAFDGGDLFQSDDTEIIASAEDENASDDNAKTGANVKPDASGEVVLTANDTVWIRVYDADEKRLYEAEMKSGDSYTVPKDAKDPMINTGRPQFLDVTVGGQKVATLGEAGIPIKDIKINAEALVSREVTESDGEN